MQDSANHNSVLVIAKKRVLILANLQAGKRLKLAGSHRGGKQCDCIAVLSRHVNQHSSPDRPVGTDPFTGTAA